MIFDPTICYGMFLMKYNGVSFFPFSVFGSNLEIERISATEGQNIVRMKNN
jgi:hypothetical protein